MKEKEKATCLLDKTFEVTYPEINVARLFEAEKHDTQKYIKRG